MGKKSKAKTSSRQRVELASLLVEERPAPSTTQVASQTVDSAIEAFLNSEVMVNLKKALMLREEAKDLQNQVRALKREQDTLALQKEMQVREGKLVAESVSKVFASRFTAQTDLKNRFLNSPKITDFRAKIVGSFNAAMEAILKRALASDAQYQELEAEGVRLTVTAEKLAASVRSSEKKIELLEKKMVRLEAEVGKKLELANSLEGGHNG